MDTEDDKRILMTQHYQRREGNVDVNKLSKELGVNRETMRRWMREEDIKQEVRDVRMLYKELKTCMQLIKSELRVYRDETERRFKKLTKTVDGFATQLKQLRR